MRLVRFSGSKIVLNFAQDMRLKPRKTPHSTIDPFTGRIILKISYMARKRFKCCRRAYLGKFSSFVSILSEQFTKMLSNDFPTFCSASVLNDFICSPQLRVFRILIVNWLLLRTTAIGTWLTDVEPKYDRGKSQRQDFAIKPS